LTHQKIHQISTIKSKLDFSMTLCINVMWFTHTSLMKESRSVWWRSMTICGYSQILKCCANTLLNHQRTIPSPIIRQATTMTTRWITNIAIRAYLQSTTFTRLLSDDNCAEGNDWGWLRATTHVSTITP